MAKTVSSRIPNDLHDELRERCNNAGCNTNDIIRGLLELELRGDTEIDFGNEEENTPRPDRNPIPKITKISHDGGKTWHDKQEESEKKNEVKFMEEVSVKLY